MSEPARMTRARLDRARRRSAEADAAVGVPLQPLDLAAILATPPPAIDWIWGGYVEAGTVCQLHGDGGAGKSLLAMALVRAAAGGHDFLNRPTFPSRALVIDGENPIPEIARRLHPGTGRDR